MQALSAYISSYIKQFPFSGSLAVIHKGELICEKYHGLADRSFQTHIGPQTVFPIASLTKAFTAMAALICVDRGLIGLHASLASIIPTYQLDSRISLHHLLSHSSGLADYKPGKGMALSDTFSRLLSDEEWQEKLFSPELSSIPGEKAHYSNPGYYLIGKVIEQLSGMAYGDFLKKEIFEPLGMSKTWVDDPVAIQPERARGYDIQGENFIHAPFTDARNFYPQGGLCSNVTDLLKWDQALNRSLFISPELHSAMLSPQVQVGLPERKQHYGYGWAMMQREGHRVIGHGGSHWGYRSHIDRYIEEELTVIVLSNFGFQDTFKLAQNMAAIVLELPYKPPLRPKAIRLAPEVFEPFLGTYTRGDFSINLRQEQDAYYLSYQGIELPIYPISATTFHHAIMDEQYEIKTDPDGNPTLWGCQLSKGE